MTATRPRPLVVDLDGAAGSDAAVQWAGEEAARAGQPVLLLASCGTADCGADDGEPAGSGCVADPEARLQAQQCLDHAHAAIDTRHPGIQVCGRVVHGNLYDTTLAIARHAAAVIIGAPGGEPPNLRYGLVDRPLTRRSPAPLVITPAGGANPPGGAVLVAATPAGDTQPVLAFAFEHARRHTAPVRVLCCQPSRRVALSPDAGPSSLETEARLFDTLAGWRASYPDVPLSAAVVAAQPTSCLIEHSAHARLLVIGARMRHGTDWALRYRIRRLLRWTGRPVAVIPAGARA